MLACGGQEPGAATAVLMPETRMEWSSELAVLLWFRERDEPEFEKTVALAKERFGG